MTRIGPDEKHCFIIRAVRVICGLIILERSHVKIYLGFWSLGFEILRDKFNEGQTALIL